MNWTKPSDSLRQAIFNSFEDRGKITTADEVDSIHKHVKDFLSQKFTTSLLESREAQIFKSIEKLWAKILK